MPIRDLVYPSDARKVVDSLVLGLQYDSAIALEGSYLSTQSDQAETPHPSPTIKFASPEASQLVRREAPGLFSRFALISMISRFERHMSLLLLQRRVIERIGTAGRMNGPLMREIMRQVQAESRNGPVRLCAEYVVCSPSTEISNRMRWVTGLYKVRNCLAHRLGHVDIWDVKPDGVGIEETKDDNTLSAVWVRPVAFLDGVRIEELPSRAETQAKLEIKFEEFEREWRVGDVIHVTPEECQGIALSLAMLAKQVLSEFEAEVGAMIGR